MHSQSSKILFQFSKYIQFLSKSADQVFEFGSIIWLIFPTFFHYLVSIPIKKCYCKAIQFKIGMNYVYLTWKG